MRTAEAWANDNYVNAGMEMNMCCFENALGFVTISPCGQQHVQWEYKVCLYYWNWLSEYSTYFYTDFWTQIVAMGSCCTKEN